MNWQYVLIGLAVVLTACAPLSAQDSVSQERSQEESQERSQDKQQSSAAVSPSTDSSLSAEASEPAISAKQSAASAKEDADDPENREIMVVVVGASGTPEYGELFAQWAEKWQEVAASSRVEFVLLGKGDSEQLDRDHLKQTLEEVPAVGASPVWLVMIGHGTFAGVAKFNLRGLDISATELSEWLKPIQRPMVVINCASSSGPFVNRLSATGRVIVTATKSGMEQNFARFGQYLVESMASADSDLDHDDEVSVQEAFVRASAEVQRFYDSEQRLATEHALIDDNGDGKGTPAQMYRGTRPIAQAKDGSQLDGKTASKLTLAPSGQRIPLTAQERGRRDNLETELEDLRTQKSELSESEYDAALERILIQLAKIYQAAEKR